MIIDFHKCYGGGGSGSGVTPQDVQQQINSALTPYWESGETKDYVDSAVSGISLDGYYTSAQTEEAIAQAVEGYATSGDMQSAFTLISETQQVAAAGFNQLEGRIDELSGNTPDISAYWTSAETKNYVDDKVVSAETKVGQTFANLDANVIQPMQGDIRELSGITEEIHDNFSAYTPTSGFSTINGSAITNGGNIVIEGGADMSAYYTSAQTDAAIAQAVSGLATEQYVQDALSGVNMDNYWTSAETQDAIDEALSAYTPTTGFSTINGSAITNGGNIVISGPDVSNYVTSAQVETQIVEKNYVTSAQVETQIVSKNYITSAETANFVTSTQVETQIDTKAAAYTPTSGFSTINGSAITNGGNIVIEGGADMSAYYTSAQTEEAISAATSGKADAANVTPKTGRNFPEWNAQGIITGSTQMAWLTNDIVNGKVRKQVLSNDSSNGFAIYAPESAGTAGQILVSTGNGAPVWSAMPAADVTKAYVDSAVTGVQDQIDTVDEVVSQALVDLNNRVDEISGATPDLSAYWTSAQTQDAISAATQDMVTSTDVRHIVKLTQAAYDQLATKDPETFYIIVNSI